MQLILRQMQIFSMIFLLSNATLKNDSIPPTNQIILTESRICSLDFNEDEILKIIKDLNIHKAHSHDDISIRMIKICAKLLLKPLFLLFHNSINSSCCSDIWKRSNTISVHKEICKQLKNTIQFPFYQYLIKFLKR